MLYLLNQKPKRQYFSSMYTSVMVIKAKSATEAVRIAEARGRWQIQITP